MVEAPISRVVVSTRSSSRSCSMLCTSLIQRAWLPIATPPGTHRHRVQTPCQASPCVAPAFRARASRGWELPMGLAAPPARGHGAIDLASLGALPDGLALVGRLLAAGEPELHLGAPAHPVEAQRDQRVSALLHLAGDLV